MAAGFSNLTRQPGFIVLAIVAAVGWLIAVWAVASGTRLENEYETRIQELEAARTAVVGQLAEMRRLAGAAADLEVQISTARRNLEQVTREREQAAAELARVRDQIGPAEKRLAELDAQIGSRAERLERVERDLATSQANLAELERRRSEATTGIAEVVASRDRILAELQQAQERSAALQQQLTGLVNRIDARTNELAAVERSLGVSRRGVLRGNESNRIGAADGALEQIPSVSGGSAQPTYGCRQTENGWVCSAE